jgi:hypothetical protein
MLNRNRFKNVTTKAVVGLSATTALDILAAVSYNQRKLDSRYGYVAITLASLSIVTLFYSMYNTPLKNLLSGFPGSLFKSRTQEKKNPDTSKKSHADNGNTDKEKKEDKKPVLRRSA